MKCFCASASTTVWMHHLALIKRMEKKLDENYTIMLPAVLNSPQNGSCAATYFSSHMIQVRWIRHVRHCRRSKDEFQSDVLLWTPTHGRASVGWPARNDLHQLCTNIECSLEELPGVMNDKDGWRERESWKSVLSVWLDDNDGDLVFLFVGIILLEWEHLLGRDFYGCHRWEEVTGFFETDTASWENGPFHSSYEAVKTLILVVPWIFAGCADS